MLAVPEEKIPECFKDESRRNVLYAPLRSKSVNPKDWNSKIDAWSQLINIYCSCNTVYSFSLESLRIVFHHNGRTPSCLNEVVKQMVQNGDIESLDAFLQKKPKSWKQWATNIFISTPISWSLNKMRNLIPSSDTSTLYVPLQVVEQEGDLLLSRVLETCRNKVVSLKELLEMENKNIDKVKDFEILFTSLYNRGKVDILELQSQDTFESGNFLIKFGDGHVLRPIEAVDLGMHTLEQNEKVLEKNIEILEDKVSECIKEAKIHMSKGHRQLAKACLRKKHEIEGRLDKKVRALHNVQILLHKLQDSKMDKGIWESYKKALAAFEITYKGGINEDAVEETMLQVGEMMEIHSDIESALGRTIIDEDANLEEELLQLLKDGKDDFNDDNKGSPQKDTDKNLVEALDNLKLDLPSVPLSPINNKKEDNMSTQLI